YYFFSSRRRHTRWPRDWSSDVCSSDLGSGWVCPALHHARQEAGLALRVTLRGHRDGVERRADDLDQERRHVHGDRHAAAAAVRQIGRASCRERAEILAAHVAWKSLLKF